MATELKITLLDTGEVQVSGPIDNMIMCYGLLECAKDVLKSHRDQKAKLVRPVTLLPNGG
jgi:hypothetical protein